MKATALIAEDETLLATDLRMSLSTLWPDLQIVSMVGDGASAVQQSLALQPDVLFLDIRMPGMSGLEAAQMLAEEWPGAGVTAHRAFPLIVFVTAYDQYALHAFERAAVDYVLKPAQADRLAQTCARLQSRLAERARASNPVEGTDSTLDTAIGQLRDLLRCGALDAPQPSSSTDTPLRVIQASAGNTITMVPIDDVLYFEAADKYVRVVTATREHLIRLSLRELQRQLDAQRFWQIHRGTIVRFDAIESAQRDEAGKLTLALRGHADRLIVSRLYADRFKGM